MYARLIGLVSAFSLLLSFSAVAGGPYGSIRIGHWIGGAFTDEATGNFSHCGAAVPYQHGVVLLLGLHAQEGWSLGFSHQAWQLKRGEVFSIDLTFDGRAQFRVFGGTRSANVITALIGNNSALVRELSKAGVMVAVIKGGVVQFNLDATSQVLSSLAHCVAVIKKGGLSAAGDFTVRAAGGEGVSGAAPARPAQKSGEISGTGFVVATEGYVVTNDHVIGNCTGDVRASLPGESAVTLRIVSKDAANDLALLKASTPFKESAGIRGTAIHPGETVIAIGYPFHKLLSSEFAVTTGIVSSLGGIGNDSRYLQISAPVQPGNSGGPLLDSSGSVVGVVSAKINALRVVQLTGTIPENVNFAIKTGTLRDFLDKNSVPYKAVAPEAERKTAEIAQSARAYALLISCTVGREPAKP
jgi:S1-C subfamily serine protease